ncbi:hypothetical protein ACP70R_015512 [Stipagrostis hirtigluma subsp. patula]
MSAAARILGLPPGFRFRPSDEELVELFLLPRARGHPALYPGVVIDDDTAASARPWELLERHGRADGEGGYFFVRSRSTGAKAGARQDRHCDGGGTWRGQKRVYHDLLVDGEKIEWSKNNLSLQLGQGKKSGSSGWVMHEYTITSPPCPSLKICHVIYSGHGQKRKRDDDHGDEPTGRRARVAAPPSASGGTAKSIDIVEEAEQVQETEHVQQEEQVQPYFCVEQPPEAEGEDGQELLAPFGVDLETFCDVPVIGGTASAAMGSAPAFSDMAVAGTMESFYNLPDLGGMGTETVGSMAHYGDMAGGTPQSFFLVPDIGDMVTGAMGSEVDLGSMASEMLQSLYNVPDTDGMVTGAMGTVLEFGDMGAGTLESVCGLSHINDTTGRALGRSCGLPNIRDMGTGTLCSATWGEYVSNTEYDEHKGRIAIGWLQAGELQRGMEVKNFNRVPVEPVSAGDICAVCGMNDIMVYGKTIADKVSGTPLPTIKGKEPTVRMSFSINTPPFVGREVLEKYVTSRNLRDRLYRELERNLAMKVEDGGEKDMNL